MPLVPVPFPTSHTYPPSVKSQPEIRNTVATMAMTSWEEGEDSHIFSRARYMSEVRICWTWRDWERMALGKRRKVSLPVMKSRERSESDALVALLRLWDVCESEEWLWLDCFRRFFLLLPPLLLLLPPPPLPMEDSDPNPVRSDWEERPTNDMHDFVQLQMTPPTNPTISPTAPRIPPPSPQSSDHMANDNPHKVPHDLANDRITAVCTAFD
mmetsp:Transcript_21024/g.37991  ORF Transcript_21024/g.37991 Transcript_21024/m.37991 type:complete len:212 (-) Transcript_21024:66-701(-)